LVSVETSMQATAVLNTEGDYRPSEDEEFMNDRQLKYFKQKLLNANRVRRSLISRRKPKTIQISLTGLRLKPIGRWNCARGIVNVS